MRAPPAVPTVSAATGVQGAIAKASAKTGVDFSYLLGQAQIESGMRTNARARTSSATGLYQFIEQSWLGVMKRHGAEHGMGWAADSIQQTASGRYVVSDSATRSAILSLRTDANAASLMAAEHASDNKAEIEGSLGREANGTDLYMAHFLGIGGAKKFLSAMQAAPDRGAASMFPAAARANRSIFYAADGSQRSLGDIYQRFAGKLDRGAQAAGATGTASGNFLAQAQVPAFAAPFPGVDVILGNEASGGDDRWLQTTMANLNVVRAADRTDQARVNALRPTPETARLAYLMLANLGA
ncbi:lytic transglycosylase domain-containing protein [Sphingomonas qomolangmaensis]|uniref:Lytic transglycosylase domain-containing protein n=1 Tax=Sphingomonas qomolangmaensis TaxID=2918765 RepID=A0ABY5L878_9SPHN|nr:lytic transglycosylase domain-containing protein [Sphingomonas qomolangmaensis]UUL82268.1 lytic transglycosylase domain-containing protein [Sphingomonas qomolangmaensis]